MYLKLGICFYLSVVRNRWRPILSWVKLTPTETNNVVLLYTRYSYTWFELKGLWAKHLQTGEFAKIVLFLYTKSLVFPFHFNRKCGRFETTIVWFLCLEV